MTDMRTIVTQAFEKSGGVSALTRWIKASASNRGQFYTHLLAKMIALPPQVNVDVTTKVDHTLDQTALVNALTRVIDARRENDAAGVVIEHEPARPPADISGVTYTRSTGTEAPPIEQPVVAAVAADRDRAAAVDRDRAKRSVSREPTTTELWHEWQARGGGNRFGGT
jgi:hypothetical protein